METKELLERAKKLRKYATIRYPMFKPYELDDLVQWACERWLKGFSLKQRSGHMVIDYFRGNIPEHVRNKTKTPTVYKLISMDAYPILQKTLYHEPDNDLNRLLDLEYRTELLNKLLKKALEKSDASLMRLILQGNNLKKSAEALGYTESNACHRMKISIAMLKKYVKTHPEFAELKDLL